LHAAQNANLFLGRELGARTDDPACYVAGKVHYDLLSRTQPFLAGIERVVIGSTHHRIALVCAEKEPLACHRTILVSRHLVARGIGVRHILANGTVEDHDRAVERLLDESGLKPDLFTGREALVARAYSLRAEQIAYRQDTAVTGVPGAAKVR
jgi:hypothetical protein